MSRNRTVKIDAFPESAFRYLERDAIVCIDVISCSTTIATAAGQGRLTYPAASPDEALGLAARLSDPLLAVEPLGAPKVSFELQNSPAALARRQDVGRPLVLAGVSGTRLIVNAAGARAAYVACYRNLKATIEHLASRHDRVALIGAGFGSEFRCEDQMAAARIARGLLEFGFQCEDNGTAELVERWGEADLALTSLGKSAAYLRRWGYEEDLDFVLQHLDDLDIVCHYDQGVVRGLPAARPLGDSVTAALRVSGEDWGRVVPFGVRGRSGDPALSNA